MTRWNRFCGTYTLDGHTPVACPDIAKWGRWMESGDRRVALTDLGAVRISTVFLGVDHGYGPSREPILFETMAFVDGEPADAHAWGFARYATWEEAEAGHARAVALCKRAIAEAEGTSTALLAFIRANAGAK